MMMPSLNMSKHVTLLGVILILFQSKKIGCYATLISVKSVQALTDSPDDRINEAVQGMSDSAVNARKFLQKYPSNYSSANPIVAESLKQLQSDVSRIVALHEAHDHNGYNHYNDDSDYQHMIQDAQGEIFNRVTMKALENGTNASLNGFKQEEKIHEKVAHVADNAREKVTGLQQNLRSNI